jgi:hypothetical protein
MPDFKRAVGTISDAEEVALNFRQAWELGFDPIENLVEMLEGHASR